MAESGYIPIEHHHAVLAAYTFTRVAAFNLLGELKVAAVLEALFRGCGYVRPESGRILYVMVRVGDLTHLEMKKQKVQIARAVRKIFLLAP